MHKKFILFYFSLLFNASLEAGEQQVDNASLQSKTLPKDSKQPTVQTDIHASIDSRKNPKLSKKLKLRSKRKNTKDGSRLKGVLLIPLVLVGVAIFTMNANGGNPPPPPPGDNPPTEDEEITETTCPLCAETLGKPDLPVLDQNDKIGYQPFDAALIPSFKADYYNEKPHYVQHYRKQWRDGPFDERKEWYTYAGIDPLYCDSNARKTWSTLRPGVKYQLVQQAALDRVLSEEREADLENTKTKALERELQNKKDSYPQIKNALKQFTFSKEGVSIGKNDIAKKGGEKTTKCFLCFDDVPINTIVYDPLCKHKGIACIACLGRIESQVEIREDKDKTEQLRRDYRCPLCSKHDEQKKQAVYAAYRLTTDKKGRQLLKKAGIELYEDKDNGLYYCVQH